MEEAIRRADEAGLVIASNKRMCQALVGSEEWQSVTSGLACWTGTMTAYEEPGKPFGKLVEYTDEKTGIRYVFPVPDEFVGMKDAILVAEHPDFTLESDGNNSIVRAARIELIDKFPPASNKWYRADPKYGIPFGEEIDDSNPDARFLWRNPKRVGLVARGYGDVDDDGRGVGLDGRPSGAFGVVVELPETDASI